jgi:hypothetical protein
MSETGLTEKQIREIAREEALKCIREERECSRKNALFFPLKLRFKTMRPKG